MLCSFLFLNFNSKIEILVLRINHNYEYDNYLIKILMYHLLEKLSQFKLVLSI